MKMLVHCVLASVLMASAPALAAGAQSSRADQNAASEAARAGRILSLREIEGRVVPRMRGAQYIGFDFDSGTAVYTLKFLRDGHVIWVAVDGRSGNVIGRR